MFFVIPSQRHYAAACERPLTARLSRLCCWLLIYPVSWRQRTMLSSDNIGGGPETCTTIYRDLHTRVELFVLGFCSSPQNVVTDSGYHSHHHPEGASWFFKAPDAMLLGHVLHFGSSFLFIFAAKHGVLVIKNISVRWKIWMTNGGDGRYVSKPFSNFCFWL